MSGQGVHEHFLAREILHFEGLVLLDLIRQSVIDVSPALRDFQVGAMVPTEGKLFTNEVRAPMSKGVYKSRSFAHTRLLLGFFKRQNFAVIATRSFNIVGPNLAHARPVMGSGGISCDDNSLCKIDRLQTWLTDKRMFERLERSSCWSRKGACLVAGIFTYEFVEFS